MAIYRAHVLVCGGTGCASSNSAKIKERFEEKVKEMDLHKEVQVISTGCFGLCEEGPIVVVYPEGAFYNRMTVEKVDKIVDEHIYKGRIVKDYLYE
jgi:NADH-quinone oxidoreductase subunit F/NADP-reducing hydrogenase subunit HndC